MGHDWIFDVLSDLKAYALANGMPRLAAKAEEALAVAHLEVKAAGEDGAAPQTGPRSGGSTGGKSH